ncbi:sugar ABC transporter substrate-binding protein [uncultured Agathobaculum sp.]|uniref:sugar ABC transporter substrate-binding protein n=1 Tax=uncultured Agathobaculum sp. TaxID=2048140 RepID=UPI00296F41F4
MNKKRVLAMLLAGAMTLSMTACGGSGGSGTKTDSGDQGGSSASGSAKYNVSVILKTLAAEYWQYVKSGAEDYAAEHPDEVTVDVKGPSSETAFDEMQNMIETDLSSGTYDGLVISPLQSDTAAQLVSGTKLPIVAVDTVFEGPEVVSFVGTGNEAAAKKGGEAAVEAAKAAGWTDIKCIEIAGVQGDETCSARMRGYEAGVTEAGGEFLTSEVQYADATADRATTAMEAIMQTHPEGIAIICAHNDDTAMAAARAAAGHEAYKNTIFLGFNGDRAACEAILSGQMTMSVAQMAYEMGYKAVETMVQALNGEKVEPVVDSGSDVVTPDNAQERLDTLKTQLH